MKRLDNKNPNTVGLYHFGGTEESVMGKQPQPKTPPIPLAPLRQFVIESQDDQHVNLIDRNLTHQNARTLHQELGQLIAKWDSNTPSVCQPYPSPTRTIYLLYSDNATKRQIQSFANEAARTAYQKQLVATWLQEHKVPKAEQLRAQLDTDFQTVWAKFTFDESLRLHDYYVQDQELNLPVPQIIVCHEGGVIHEVLSDQPVKLTTVDHDIEGADETALRSIPQNDGHTTTQYCIEHAVDCDAHRVKTIFNTIQEPKTNP